MATQKQLRERLAKAQKDKLTALECLAHFAGNFSKTYGELAEAVADEKVSKEEFDHIKVVAGTDLSMLLGAVRAFMDTRKARAAALKEANAGGVFQGL